MRNLSVSGAVRSLSVSGGPTRSLSVADLHTVDVDVSVVQDATKATEAERSMTLMQGLKLYPKAVGWSMLLSTAIIMEGFDLVLISSLFGLEAFQNKFGTLQPDGTMQISAAWQSGLANGALVGEILGLMASGIISERIGYRKTMIGALIMVTCLIFIVFFAENLPMLLAGEILCGLPWGVFQTLTTTYAAEVCPVALRAYLTTYVNLCWVFGQFLSSGVLKGVANRTDALAYKLPFALQWIWPVPLIVGIFLAPESPWWLVRQGRNEEAKVQVLRLTSRNQPGFDADETVGMMVHTTELEKAATEGASYLACFQGTNLHRTEIVSVVWIVQIWCGNTLNGYSTYFYEQAGLAPSNAFTLTLVQYGLGAIGTILSWFLMVKFGRRQLYLVGQLVLFILLLGIGFAGIPPKGNSGAQWAVGSLLIVWVFVYDATVGPVCYSLVAELSSTRLRNKTVVLARNVYNIAGIISSTLTPHMLNPEAWNWGAKAAFFFAGTCFLCMVWTYFRLPEPKGRTYAELDMLFELKVPARQFRTTVVDPFATTIPHDVHEQAKGATAQIEKIGSKHS